MFAFGPVSSGPRPWLLPHPIPHLIVTPPSPSPEDAGPTFLLERARRGGRRSQRPPSPELLHSAWTRRSSFSSYGHHSASPRLSLRPSHDPYAPYVPPPTPSAVTLLAALLLPWFSAVSESLPPAGEGEGKRRRRQRTSASPLALIFLLFGGTLVLSAGLHAYTYSSEIDFELVDPGTGGGIFVRSNLNPTTEARKDDVGLYLPPKASSQGWRESSVRKQPAVAAASPREQGAAGFDVHVWDLL